ncbi:uncharacterized protein LOC126778071 isoform X2 [Nymphalis io]|uniref:uncharacterized protein LOC126778071 isoform X2 n=1 Tax=Inachis io TaxID=171585 RepID=UPI002169925B|nr:uncharacterized protein LOC126778071 isoform X2 [Nymphalis io]
MEESEDNMSSEDISTSRYGRARRIKTDSEFCDNEKAATKNTKSPNPKLEKSPNTIQSPVYKMHASNSPIRVETPKHSENSLDNTIESIYTENISLSRFGSEEKKCKSSTKKYPKVYIRKDLIQTKDKDSDDTVVLIKNMFSPSNSKKTSNYLKSLDDSEKYNTHTTKKVSNGHLNSVVKTLDFGGNKKKKNVELKMGFSKSELFEMEAKSEYQVGDLAWARMGTYPFWPCIVTRDPLSEMFIKKKLFGRIERDVLHVTFFGDNGRRGWIVDSMLRKFLGQLEFESARINFTPEAKKKDPRLYSAFFISDKKISSWQVSVKEAESLLREPKRLRIDILNDMLEKSRVVKGTPKQEKSKKITRTNSDVSLSESLYDTLFSEDDSKTNDSERSRSKSRNRSLNVSEVVTACLDNMAAKTGITKIQRQSHMDRWLQKAKSKTPEKTLLKSHSSKSISAKTKKKLPRESQSKMVRRFRKSSLESQSEIENKLASNQNEHDYSQNCCKRNSPVMLDDVEIEYENAEIFTTDSVGPGSGIGIISKVETLCHKDSMDKNEDDMIMAVVNDGIIVPKANVENEICNQINEQSDSISDLSSDVQIDSTSEEKLENSKTKKDSEVEKQSQTEAVNTEMIENMEIDDDTNNGINESSLESAIINNKELVIEVMCGEPSNNVLSTDGGEECMEVSDLNADIESNNMNEILNNELKLINTFCISSSVNDPNVINEESSANVNILQQKCLNKKLEKEQDEKKNPKKELSKVFKVIDSKKDKINVESASDNCVKISKLDNICVNVDNNVAHGKIEEICIQEGVNNKERSNDIVKAAEESKLVMLELKNQIGNDKEIIENGLGDDEHALSDNEEDVGPSAPKFKTIIKYKLSLNKSAEKISDQISNRSDIYEKKAENSDVVKTSSPSENKAENVHYKNCLISDNNIISLDSVSSLELVTLDGTIITQNGFIDHDNFQTVENVNLVSSADPETNNGTEINSNNHNDEMDFQVREKNIDNMDISNYVIQPLQTESDSITWNGYHETNKIIENIDIAKTSEQNQSDVKKNTHNEDDFFIESNFIDDNEEISPYELGLNTCNISVSKNLIETDNTDVYDKTELETDEKEPDNTLEKPEDSDVSLGKKKQRLKDKPDNKTKFEEPDFLKYLELRQDAVMDEHPELSLEDITKYLYNTWLYEENLKTDTKKADDMDQANLVKGLNQDKILLKKIRKKTKVDKEPNYDKEANVQKEKSKRRIIRPYYKEDFSDGEDEVEYFDIFKVKQKAPKQIDNLNEPVINENYQNDFATSEYEEEMGQNEIDQVEEYFRQLTAPKPNLFKGLIREKVCEICERVGNLVKCKGCHSMFHTDCDKKQTEIIEVSAPTKGGRKKKKKRGRKAKEDINSLDSESQSDDKSQDANVSDEIQNTSIDEEESHIVADADIFEAQLSAKMKEILETPDELDYDSYSNDENDWNDIDVGECKIVDIKPRRKDQEENIDYSDFKCYNCLKYDKPICFVCKSSISPKDKAEHRQRCQVAHCQKYYHLECLDHWPQTQFNAGELSRTNKSNEFCEALSCPRHVCHTCVCDDPRGCKTRFSGDKLARCIRCPATYHTFTKCLPAGTQILTGSHIICPRHYEHRPGKVPCHVNTGWCFICALGGSLICCEYCPTSFHAECLNIKPPEGGYMCEDCETGRLPLYGEMVWVKLGHYRWWPGIILHPSEIPHNILAVKHSQGEFVVRFFGQYDHYWVNRGRVFPFQEGDSGKVSSQKSKIDAAFTMAMEHAQRACEILKTASTNDEESIDIASSLLPPHYVKLRVNKPCGSLCGRKIDIEESSLTQCDCDPADVDPCGPYTQCLNRMLLTECGPTCRAGDRCNNRAFEKRLYPKMTPYRTPHRGWGLKTLVDVKAGQFVIEYVGELIDEDEFQRRMRRKHEVRDENFYFLTLDKERMIDAGPKGNFARFMNHSCEPNCETQKWTVLGDIRVGLFALYDIPANSELTFNYNLESAGIEKKRCMCGAKRCSGYIGAKPKQDDQPKKSKITTKRTYKRRKQIEDSPSTSRTKPKNRVGRPNKPRELTEIEKDLLIIKNATSGISSDSECSGRLSSIDSSRDAKALKRKRINVSTEDVPSSPSTKRMKSELKSSELD